MAGKYLFVALLFAALRVVINKDDDKLENAPSPRTESKLSGSLADGSERSLGVCWGYEPNCTRRLSFSEHMCTGSFTGWAANREEAEATFFRQADFGYVKERQKEMTAVCSSHPNLKNSSQLICSRELQFCSATNIMIDFRGIADKVNTHNLRYQMDVLSPGEVRLHCNSGYNRAWLQENLNYLSPLQSWAPELRNLEMSDASVMNEDCDITVEKPTYIMKIDATVNMYHHFCDFVNLYTSLHVNQSEGGHTFNTDTQILLWENFPYMSNFAPAWTAFSKNPVWSLKQVAGKRVCFKQAMFPLLARMMYGLYYNTPLISGCSHSGLFKAFSEFMLRRLNIERRPPGHKLRLTLLARDTKHRRIVNEAELVAAAEKTNRFDITVARFSHSQPFLDQLTVISNTDILVGMHGAGLTHLLFLPDWAGVFELYHCDDPGCYSDLARLRGVKYQTWERDSLVFPVEQGKEGGAAHKKFVNYRFDVGEFLSLLERLEEGIRTDPKYGEAVEDRGLNTEDRGLNTEDQKGTVGGLQEYSAGVLEGRRSEL